MTFLEGIPAIVVEDEAAFCAVDQQTEEGPKVLGHWRADRAFLVAVRFEVGRDPSQQRRLDVEVESMRQEGCHITI